ncbi:tyrosine-type recombinase/integrase [Collinsella tanakaei]
MVSIAGNLDGHNFDRWFRNFCVDNDFGAYSVIKKEFTKNGKKHIRGTGYSGLVPHALRHTQATLLIGEGADIKTVQARLGHASPSTTLSIYSHAIESKDREAAEAFDSLVS